MLDINNIPLDDEKTWNLICSGRTIGCFQIESNLGKSWCQRIKPRNIEELAVLISIIRPGCLDAILDGKSLTQHYSDRKNGKEDVSYIDKSLEEILQSTQGILTYQEQAILIAQKIAGFDLKTADLLRKSIGKKSSELMAKVEQQFLDGCKQTNIVNEDVAKEIFGWIKESQRYSFNKSLLPTTTVNNKQGEITLGELQIGDYVQIPSLKDDQQFAKVLVKYDHGILDVWHITLTNGYSLDCTLDHKLYCTDLQCHPIWFLLANNKQIICEDGVAEIYSIHKMGRLPTLDIKIDSKDHVYFANGIGNSNSHAVSYAINSYTSAFCKANYPLQFFCAYLRGAQHEQDPLQELNELITDAKQFGYEVYVPDFRSNENTFHIYNNALRFGVGDVKSVGSASLLKINSAKSDCAVLLNKKITDWRWTDYLIGFSSHINSASNIALISCGALDYLRQTRSRMLFELNVFNKLTKKESSRLKENIQNIESLTKGIEFLLEHNMFMKPRRGILENLAQTLDNPPYSCEDKIEWVAYTEKKYLGYALSVNKVDDCPDAIRSNITCKELSCSPNRRDNILLAVEISSLREITIKNGPSAGMQMAFLTVTDSSGTLDNIACFAETWEQLKLYLYVGNTVLLRLERSRKRKDSFTIKSCYQI